MIGALFTSLRAHSGMLRTLFFVALAAILGLNFVVRPEEAHFGYDSLPGFFAVFGVVAGLVMLVVLEKIVRPLIGRKEDFYGDI